MFRFSAKIFNHAVAFTR